MVSVLRTDGGQSRAGMAKRRRANPHAQRGRAGVCWHAAMTGSPEPSTSISCSRGETPLTSEEQMKQKTEEETTKGTKEEQQRDPSLSRQPIESKRLAQVQRSSIAVLLKRAVKVACHVVNCYT